MWIVALFPIFAEANRCLGLTIEGGGAKGAYSAAVMKAFTENLPAEDLEYDIIVGVSAGGLNTGAYSQFPKGQEAQAADFALNIWKTVKYAGDIYTTWPVWPPVNPILGRPSLFNTTPLRNLVQKNIFGEIQRKVKVGTTNNDLGQFELIDGDVGIERFGEALMCSSAMPALFPYQTTSFSSSGKNSTYVDGGVIINLDVSTPIQWCLDQGFKREEIYVDILFDSNVASYDDNFTPKNTIDLLAQVNDLKSHYSGFNYASNVMNAFPEVNYRYIVIPREPLTSTFIFNELAIEYLISDGKKDGEYYAKMGPSKEMIQMVKNTSRESKRIINADQLS